MKIETYLAAALDGQDWPGAALALLANPLSQYLSEDFSAPLADIVFRGDIDPEEMERRVTHAAALMDELERAIERDR